MRTDAAQAPRSWRRPGRPDVVWPLRRSWLARGVLRTVRTACLGMLAVVAVITLFFVWAFGHPVAWGVIGSLFGVLPLAGLLLSVGLELRAALAAGPRWVAVRFLLRWRVVDLGAVRAVHLGGDSPFVPFFRFGGGRPGVPGAPGGPAAGGGGGGGVRSVVFEDAEGRRINVDVGVFDADLADVVRRGLGPDVAVDPAVADVLELGPGSEEPDRRP